MRKSALANAFRISCLLFGVFAFGSSSSSVKVCSPNQRMIFWSSLSFSGFSLAQAWNPRGWACACWYRSANFRLREMESCLCIGYFSFILC